MDIQNNNNYYIQSNVFDFLIQQM